MKKFRTVLLTALIAAIALSTAGCATYKNFEEAFFGSPKESSDIIKIGVLEPLTGNDSPMGEMEVRGIELAYKLKPEVLGKKIELIYADTQSSIYVTETAVDDLIDKEPVIVLGSYGDTASLIASQKLGKVKIPAISITAANPLITANNEYYFRVTFTDASQGQALAKYVFEGLNLTKAGIVRIKNEDTATEMIGEFNQTLTDLTGDEECVSATIEVPEGGGYDQAVQEISESGVQAVFAPVSLKEAEKLFAASSKAGLQNVTFIGPKEWHTDQLIGLQQKYPGIKIAAASDFASSINASGAETELYDEFVAAYKKEYGGEEPSEAAALGFDAYMIAVQAMETAGATDAEALKDAVLSISGFGGASGEISFNEKGEPKKPINVDMIQNGKFVSVFTVK